MVRVRMERPGAFWACGWGPSVYRALGRGVWVAVQRQFKLCMCSDLCIDRIPRAWLRVSSAGECFAGAAACH